MEQKKRTLRDAAREGKEQSKISGPVITTLKPTPVALKGDKPSPIVVGSEDVTLACGHPGVFPLFSEKQDRYRKERRDKFLKSQCKDCKAKNAADVEAKQQAAKAARMKAKGPNVEKRLPDGSRFHVAYNSQDVMWTGSLEVQIERNGTVEERRFTASCSGVFRLLRKLDMMYRESGVVTSPDSPT